MCQESDPGDKEENQRLTEEKLGDSTGSCLVLRPEVRIEREDTDDCASSPLLFWLTRCKRLRPDPFPVLQQLRWL